MADRPILFSAPMVRAILAGKKSQTRRVVKPQPTDERIAGAVSYDEHGTFVWLNGHDGSIVERVPRCPYGKRGDRLWVRETFAKIDGQTRPWIETDYRATYNHGDRLGDALGVKKRWTPAIYMPRAASRITLEITGVRVERVGEISHGDCLAEGIVGVPFYPDEGFPLSIGYMAGPDDKHSALKPEAIDAYRSLWVSLNGEASWDANPWVWVIEFRRADSDNAGSAGSRE